MFQTPYNPHGTLHVSTKPDDISLLDWMAQTPHVPMPIAPLSEQRKADFTTFTKALKESVRLMGLREINMACYVGERQIAHACHELQDFTLAQLSADEALALWDQESNPRRKASLFELAQGLDARTTYTTRLL